MDVLFILVYWNFKYGFKGLTYHMFPSCKHVNTSQTNRKVTWNAQTFLS